MLKFDFIEFFGIIKDKKVSGIIRIFDLQDSHYGKDRRKHIIKNYFLNTIKEISTRRKLLWH